METFCWNCCCPAGCPCERTVRPSCCASNADCECGSVVRRRKDCLCRYVYSSLQFAWCEIREKPWQGSRFWPNHFCHSVFCEHSVTCYGMCKKQPVDRKSGEIAEPTRRRMMIFLFLQGSDQSLINAVLKSGKNRSAPCGMCGNSLSLFQQIRIESAGHIDTWILGFPDNETANFVRSLLGKGVVTPRGKNKHGLHIFVWCGLLVFSISRKVLGGTRCQIGDSRFRTFCL